MKLLEYQARELFQDYGIPVPKGVVVAEKSNAATVIEGALFSFPIVLKAQVAVGGRGKAGGIRFAESLSEAGQIVDDLLFSDLKGFKVNHLLVVEKADVSREWYLSIILDRTSGSPRILFSAEGGVEIEETASTNPDVIVSAPINPLIGVTKHTADYICSKSGIGLDFSGQVLDLVSRLYQVFIENSCLMAEINPIAVGADGSLMAIDGKVEVDDSALYRLPKVEAFREVLDEPERVLEARKHRLLYIPLVQGARVAVMSNGSGMLMNMVDLLSQKGVDAACALDMGGGATRERYAEAVRISLSTPGVDMLFVYIFGGITRCDEVAAGVKMALENETGSVIIRMEGTRKEDGMEIICQTPDVMLANGIVEGVEMVNEYINR